MNKAAQECDVDIDSFIAIGDRLRDFAICKETGCRGILISEENTELPDHVIRVFDWEDLVRKIGRVL